MRQSKIFINNQWYILKEEDNLYWLSPYVGEGIPIDYDFNDYFLEECYSSPNYEYIYFVINEKNEVKTLYLKGNSLCVQSDPGYCKRERLEDKERFPYKGYVPYCSFPPK